VREERRGDEKKGERKGKRKDGEREAMMIETRTRSLELADPTLLEKIDKLFACNVGQYVNHGGR
jgi:hypothetical protein